MRIAAGSTSQSLEVELFDDAGLALTGKVAADFPAVYYARTREARVAIDLSDLASIDAGFTAGGVFEVGGGRYRLDVPDAAWATASMVSIIGEASGKHVLHEDVEVYAATTGATVSGAAQGAAYLDVEDADALAAVLPGLASYKAATDDAKAAALLEASDRVDTAYKYQGRKYDMTAGAQPREFPRVAYDVPVYNLPGGGSGVNVGGGTVWDLDASNNPVVPARVLQAVLYEADAILAGDKFKNAKDAIAAGLTGQSFGGMSESYRTQGVDGATPLLCRMADVKMRFYMLRQGRIL